VKKNDEHGNQPAASPAQVTPGMLDEALTEAEKRLLLKKLRGR